MSPEDFVSNYAEEHLYEQDAPKGMCDGCPHYRRGIEDGEDEDDWCWLKEGKYADGRENECPAWIASQNDKASRSAGDNTPTK